MAVPKRPLASPRVRITETGRILHIVIPARRCWFAIIFTSVWLCGWTVGECLALLALLTGKSSTGAPLLFLLWLFAWTCGGLWQWFVLLWNLRGREIVVVEGATLWIRWAIGKRGYTREFALAHVCNPRIDPPPAFWDISQLIRPEYVTRYVRYLSRRDTCGGSGQIAFDYGRKTYRFGQKLSDAEAIQIVSAVKGRLPSG